MHTTVLLAWQGGLFCTRHTNAIHTRYTVFGISAFHMTRSGQSCSEQIHSLRFIGEIPVAALPRVPVFRLALA